uniref:Protein HGH1 homolog n=1 Tax=Odontella aurita TaxID=265563 RepID=A0A7S4IVQ6_9STRA
MIDDGDDDVDGQSGRKERAVGGDSLRRRRTTRLIKSLLDPPPPPNDGPPGGGAAADARDSPRLVDSLLDLLCPPPDAAAADGAGGGASHSSSYSRVLSLRLLRSLVDRSPSLLQSRLLRAPDGLNRLVDLLDPSASDEGLRNEAVLLATDLARTSGNSARLIIFSEGYDKALSIACDAEGGLGGGAAGLGVASDCVRLCLELTRHDGMGAEVLLGSGSMLE